MKRRHLPSFFLLASTATLLGCGVSTRSSTPTPSPAPTPAPTYLQLTGNWEAIGRTAAGSTTLPSPVAAFSGALQSTNGIVTGTLHALVTGPNILDPCVRITQDLPATGTLDPAGNLNLTVAIAGGTATLAVPLTQDLHAYANGTYQIAGGACAMLSTPMFIAQFASLTGTFTGTLNSPVTPGFGPTAPGSVQATATLAQATTPNADGLFPLSGTVALTGSCTATFSFTDGTVSGDAIDLAYAPANSFVPTDRLIGGFTPPATTIVGSVVLIGSSCPYFVFTGSLNR